MKKEFIIGAIAIIVLAVAGVWLVANVSTKPAKSKEGVSAYVEGDKENIKATLTYTDGGFVPMALTVKSGDTIRIVNNSTIELSMAVGDHEAHEPDSELGIPTLDPGKDIVIKVSKVRVSNFHNHIRHDQTGTLTVE